MWYGLYCYSQKEQETLLILKHNLSKRALKDAFIFTYDRMRRYEGDWHMERVSMFPGYVFLVSNEENLLTEELRECGVFGRGNKLIRIGRKNEEFLFGLCGEEHNLMMSRGILQGKVAQVTEGPLKAAERQICKIDRHKRLATVEMPAGRNFRYILAGLEIKQKCLPGKMI